MKIEMFMRKENGAIDVFAVFMNVNSMMATESNFAVLRKNVDRIEQKVIKYVRMHKLKGVSVGIHPFFQKRGSYDGEKMVVALRIIFNGEQYYDQVSNFLQQLGLSSRSMSVASKVATRGQIVDKVVKRILMAYSYRYLS